MMGEQPADKGRGYAAKDTGRIVKKELLKGGQALARTGRTGFFDDGGELLQPCSHALHPRYCGLGSQERLGQVERGAGEGQKRSERARKSSSARGNERETRISGQLLKESGRARLANASRSDQQSAS